MRMESAYALFNCKTNEQICKVFSELNLQIHDADRNNNRITVFFEPEFNGDRIDGLSLPIEIFNKDTYMPAFTISWLEFIGGK